MSFWDEISPFSPIGATLALLFVLLVSGVKAIAEDVKRHSQDNVTNTTPAVVVDPRTGIQILCFFNLWYFIRSKENVQME